MWRGLIVGGMAIALAWCAPDVAIGEAPRGPRISLIKWNLFSGRQELVSIDRAGAMPLRLAGGGERTRPLPEEFSTPSWSSDGSQIAFGGITRGLFDGPRGNRVFIVGADGKRLRRVPGTRGASEPVFSPDGGAVVFARYWRHGPSIWYLDLSRGKPRRISRVRKGVYLATDAFTPDGATLIASSFTEGRESEDVVALDLASRRLKLVARRAMDPALSPDGTRLALIRVRPVVKRDGKRSYGGDVYTSRIDGSGLRRLTRTKYQNESSPSWDPSGDRIAFVRSLPEPVENELIALGVGSSVMQINADGTCPRVIVKPSIDVVEGVAWQPGPGRGSGPIKC